MTNANQVDKDIKISPGTSDRHSVGRSPVDDIYDKTT